MMLFRSAVPGLTTVAAALAAVALAVAVLTAPAALAQKHPPKRAGTATPATQRASGERLAQMGLTRVSDLFWFLNGWDAYSLDGYAARPAAAGLPGAPLVVAGGQPFARGPFGQSALEALPVSLRQVQQVEASRAPRLTAGRLAPNGTVRLSLRPPTAGFEVRGAFSAGNEIGDPGPFRSTGRDVLNVDRIGPQFFAAASLRGARGASAQLSLHAVRHYTTDRALRARTENVQDTLDGPPLQQLVAPRLTLRDGAWLPGTHRLTAHYAALRALPFFRTLGYELPARRREARVTVQGEVGALARYRLGYRRATLASDAARFRTPRPALSFDWTEDHLSGHLGTGRLPLGASGSGHAPATLRAGVSGDYTRVQAAGAPLDNPDVLTARAYAALSAPGLFSAWRPRLTVLLSQTDGQLGGGAILSMQRTLAEGSSAALQLGYVRRSYAAEGALAYWHAQGLPVPQAPDGRVALPGTFPASERFTVDLRLRHAFAGGLRLMLEGGARHFQSLTLPDADYGFAPVRFPDYAPPGGRLVPDLRLRTDAAGQTFYAAAEGTYVAPDGLTHRLRYDFFAHHAAGTGGVRRAFEQRFQRTPRHRLRYTARLAVGNRFSLAARLDARSAERWPAYRRAAAAGGNAYHARLPARLRVDLTGTKRLWRNHLRVRLALRNLLDAPVRPHPAGPVDRLTLFLSVEAEF